MTTAYILIAILIGHVIGWYQGWAAGRRQMLHDSLEAQGEFLQGIVKAGLDKSDRWITERIADITDGTNTYKNCTMSRPMPDDYFDEDGVY